MKFFVSASLLSLAGLVASANIGRSAGVSCSEADRFGDPTVTPSTGLKVGSSITVNVDLTCSNQFGFDVTALDYAIAIPANLNNGVAQTVSLGHHSIAPGAVHDSLTATIPNAHFVSGQTYNLVLTNSFVNDGVATSGGVLTPITFA
ncbi:hypothetical protein CPC08DRAFT_804019 [Agrocybe pediades]|nr:hypothetical protein CPC08DRAFT_804019 [Agrocybe pediades]